jgi:hypothetical protein
MLKPVNGGKPQFDFKGTAKDEFETNFESTVGNAFLGDPAARQAAHDGMLALYAGYAATTKGGLSGAYSDDAFNNAANAFLGTEKTNINGNDVFPPYGMDVATFKQSIVPSIKSALLEQNRRSMPSSGISNLNLTKQEEYLYNHHVNNLLNGKSVHNADGSTSTIFQMVVGHDGKFYNIPTVWDGKKVGHDEAVKRASSVGWDKWPSYNSPEEADARYSAMHEYMGKDIGKPLNVFSQQQIEALAEKGQLRNVKGGYVIEQTDRYGNKGVALGSDGLPIIVSVTPKKPDVMNAQRRAELR